MVDQISIQAYLAKKISALRVLEHKGVEAAVRIYPEFNLLIMGLKSNDRDSLRLLRQSLINEMQTFKDA